MIQILKKGYFPKELPPVFQTEDFANFILKQGDLSLTPPKGKKSLISCPSIHNLARPGQLRRKLQVPNPLNMFELAKKLESGWKEIRHHFSKSNYSLSKPVKSGLNRAFSPQYSGNDLPKLRCRHRAVSRFITKTDISRFYNSIYTHSIPWALKGKNWAKKHRKGGLANELDRILRNSQDGQTLGIPIGPDSSLIIAEIIGTAIDTELQDRFPDGFRFMDDFELSFRSRSEAESGIVAIEETLAEFELGINPLKTSIEKLPQPLDRAWVNTIRQYNFRQNFSVSESALFRYFSHVFELAGSFSFEPIISYAVGRLRNIQVEDTVWPSYENLLYQCAISDPSALSIIVEMIHKHSNYGISNRLETVLNEIIIAHSPLGHGSEVAWSIWSACIFNQRLSKEAQNAASGLNDPFVSLMVLLANEKGLFPNSLDNEIWRPRVSVSELYGRNWPVAYEVRLRGWFPKLAKKSDIPKDSDFRLMLDNQVSFMNLSPELPAGFMSETESYGNFSELPDENPSGKDDDNEISDF